MTSALASLGVGGAGAGGGGPTVLLKDAFTGTDGTNLTAHTMDVGPGGTAQNGTWQLSGNQAEPSGASPGGVLWLATADSGQSDVTAKADVTLNTASGGDTGIVVRWSDNNNFWIVALFKGGSHSGLEIIEVSAGASISRATTNTDNLNLGTAYTVQVVASGATLTATIDGGNSTAYASATHNQTATVCGLRGYASTDTLDNFQVTSP